MAAGGDLMLAFTYTNWRGHEHRYVIEPEGIALGLYDQGASPNGRLQWVLNGMVVTRDGDPRPGMGNRRRTFLMSGLRQIETVSDMNRRELADQLSLRVRAARLRRVGTDPDSPHVAFEELPAADQQVWLDVADAVLALRRSTLVE